METKTKGSGWPPIQNTVPWIDMVRDAWRNPSILSPPGECCLRLLPGGMHDELAPPEKLKSPGAIHAGFQNALQYDWITDAQSERQVRRPGCERLPFPFLLWRRGRR